MHYCCQCGYEIPGREKVCPNCGNPVEYLCALPPMPSELQSKRKSSSASSLTKWIIIYFVAILFSFGSSYVYFSSPGLQALFGKSQKTANSTTSSDESTKPVLTSTATLKSSYNLLSVATQKSVALFDNFSKVHVAGDPTKTAQNYRSIQRQADAILGQLSISPDSAGEIGSVLAPLKETLMLLAKSATIMADYLDGKLSLSPPNPDWVARSQEYSAQARARLKETQESLAILRKKIE